MIKLMKKKRRIKSQTYLFIFYVTPKSTLSLSLLLFDFKNTGTQLLDFNSLTSLKLTNSASLEFSQESNDTQNLTLSKIRVHPSYLSVIMGLLRHLKIKSDNGELHDIPITQCVVFINISCCFTNFTRRCVWL